jgi:hypothetical protein
VPLTAIGALWSCGQPEPEGRRRHPGGIRPQITGQMVAFVEDDKFEVVAEVFHLDPRAIIGGHTDGAQPVSGVADKAHLDATIVFDAAGQLVRQRPGRRHKERVRSNFAHQTKSHLGLPAARGHYHHAAPGSFPGRHRLDLVEAQSF